MAVFGDKNDTTFLTTVNQKNHPDNQDRKIEKELDESVVQSFYQQVNDPRQSTRIQRLAETKNKIAQDTEKYQQEVKRMQDEIKAYKNEIK